jgi:nucleoside phosphorylase
MCDWCSRDRLVEWKSRDNRHDTSGRVVRDKAGLGAAGLMNSFLSLVIRGICDYADSHESKRWQP